MAQVNHITIPGFAKMSKQRMFNKAISHISVTRTKSINEYGTCVYSGSGCNARPLIAHSFLTADTLGKWSGLVEAGLASKNNVDFIDELQSAHDCAYAGSDGEQFMESWKYEMRKLAQRWNLSTSTLDKVEV